MANVNQRPETENGATEWPNGFDMVIAMQRPALEALAEINTRFIERFQEANATWSEFLQSRFREDMAMPQQLAGCHSMQDMVRVYSEFVQKAAQQYQQEFAEIARIGQTITSQTAAIVREKVEEASRDLKH